MWRTIGERFGEDQPFRLSPAEFFLSVFRLGFSNFVRSSRGGAVFVHDFSHPARVSLRAIAVGDLCRHRGPCERADTHLWEVEFTPLTMCVGLV